MGGNLFGGGRSAWQGNNRDDGWGRRQGRWGADDDSRDDDDNRWRLRSPRSVQRRWDDSDDDDDDNWRRGRTTTTRRWGDRDDDDWRRGRQTSSRRWDDDSDDDDRRLGRRTPAPRWGDRDDSDDDDWRRRAIVVSRGFGSSPPSLRTPIVPQTSPRNRFVANRVSVNNNGRSTFAPTTRLPGIQFLGGHTGQRRAPVTQPQFRPSFPMTPRAPMQTVAPMHFTQAPMRPSTPIRHSPQWNQRVTQNGWQTQRQPVRTSGFGTNPLMAMWAMDEMFN